MSIRKIIVTGLPNEPGEVLEGHQLITAVKLSADAKAAGLEGKVFLVDDNGEVREFNTTTKAKGALLAKAPWTP